jgi:NAD(P) transhydrogenase subunit alpha
MRLAVLKERRANETRVAATPETVRKLVQLGLQVAVEAGAGAHAAIADADFAAAGAEIAPNAKAALANAGVVFAVQLPEPAERAAIPSGALVVCISGIMADKSAAPALAQAGLDVAAMELLPRITRAQAMDVLSSQANLAGYRAVIEGAHAFDRGFPMMMTAAGTVPPARVFVIGAGVAGLQAIATARRLGAIVSATDVRPAAKEEIKSLGASFVGVEDAETASQTGAYAKEMSQDFRRKQAELMAATVAKNDLVICTALVQGGRAPTLVTQAMVDAMKPGSVVVDLAADGGGNCEATKPGEAWTTPNGVKILGYQNWPGRISVAASALYARNLLTFLTTFWDKDAKAPKLPEDDAIIKGVMLTRGGAVVHAMLAPPPASDAAPVPPATTPDPAPAAAPTQDSADAAPEHHQAPEPPAPSPPVSAAEPATIPDSPHAVPPPPQDAEPPPDEGASEADPAALPAGEPAPPGLPVSPSPIVVGDTEPPGLPVSPSPIVVGDTATDPEPAPTPAPPAAEQPAAATAGTPSSPKPNRPKPGKPGGPASDGQKKRKPDAPAPKPPGKGGKP